MSSESAPKGAYGRVQGTPLHPGAKGWGTATLVKCIKQFSPG